MTNTIRDLLISLSSHMAYMQGQLEARHELDDLEGFYWYRESVALRQKVTDALADEPAVPGGREPAAVTGQPSDGEVAELVGEALYLVRKLCDQADDLSPSLELFGLMHQAAFSLTRAAELLRRQALVPEAER